MAKELKFERGGPSGRVEVSQPGNVDVKVSLRGIRGALHLGHHAFCQLHWAVLDENGGWCAPTMQPQGSNPVDAVASRITCSFECVMSFPKDHVPSKITFVVFVSGDNQEHWLKAAGGGNFEIPVAELAEEAVKAAEAAAAAAKPVDLATRLAPASAARLAERPKDWPERSALASQKAHVQKGSANVVNNLGKIEWQVMKAAGQVAVFLEASLPLPAEAQLYMHFGCLSEDSQGADDWELPEEPIAGSTPTGDGRAARILFEGQARAVLKFGKVLPATLVFDLYAAGPGGDQYIRNEADEHFQIGVSGQTSSALTSEQKLARQFVAAETRHTHWTHFQRLCMVKDLFTRPNPLNQVEAAWIACDLRLASQKVLEWYRKRGYQPKDMAHCQEAVGGAMAQAVQAASSPTVRALLRLAVRCVPRGSSSGGDDIRHGILNIMRNHGIKEGHRPGIECKFIEAWHQKLHTNSAPDDIAICEGYLAFLGSGNVDDLWRTVWENAGLSREDLGKMCQAGWRNDGHGLNVHPLHLPQLTNDMKGYLHLLKRVHGGTDFQALAEACKGQYPDHGAECMAFEILHNRDNPFIMGKIVDLRGRLKEAAWKRDVIMLDVALEDQLRMLAERQDFSNMGRDDLLGVMACLLQDLGLSRSDASLGYGTELYSRLTVGDAGGMGRWTPEWCKHMLAACDRLSLVCSGLADRVAELLQSCADQLNAAGSKPGAVFAPDPKVLATFGEETARCLSERLVAQCLKHLQPQLRKGAGLGPWEVVSQGCKDGVSGSVAVLKALPDRLEPGLAPCVAVTETLTGWEDIPAGIVAVLLPAAHAVDVLSHVAIRARNQKVLLASCDDDALLAQLRQMRGSSIMLSVDVSGSVTWSTAEAGKKLAFEPAPRPKTLTVAKPPPPPAPILPMQMFGDHRRSLGGKSFHLSELKPRNSEYDIPVSSTVPYGIFEAVLNDSRNVEVREKLSELLEEEKWAEARQQVQELQLPERLEKNIIEALQKAGAPLPGDGSWQHALKSVWASKWTDRAVSSRKQMNVPDDVLMLAVLVQPLAFAAYAFVIHTRSPLATAKPDDALVEVVVGLGESLVSNSPGRALSATVGPGGRAIEVHTFPSKPDGVFAPQSGTHIFRSDSNGEDLEGFAGAGLYDSVTVVECPHGPVNYVTEPLLFDVGFRESLLRRLFDLGRLVEANFKGQPQDIEGAVLSSGKLVVLQSRPQV